MIEEEKCVTHEIKHMEDVFEKRWSMDDDYDNNI